MKNTMYIMDCRPKLSAVGNMAKGLGMLPGTFPAPYLTVRRL